MIIDLCTDPTHTKICEPESKTATKKLPKTIARRHSFDSMMKFLSHREALFMIPELPGIEEEYSSSFTVGDSPTKPRTRKTAKTNTAQPLTKKNKKKKSKKSIVRNSLAKALSVVDSADNYISTKQKPQLHSSQNSVTTCSTASLTDEESDISSKDNFEKREVNEGKRQAAALWEAPLLRGNRRWCEHSQYLGDEHFLYANVRRRRRDIAPVCPVRKYDE